VKFKKIIKFGCLSIFLFIFISILIVYFSFPILLKRINNEIIKKLNIKYYSVDKIKISLKSIYLNNAILELDDNKKIFIKKIYANFSIRSFLEKNYILNEFIIDGINIYYIDKEEKKEEELNINKLLEIPLMDINVIIKKGIIGIEKIYYETKDLKTEIENYNFIYEVIYNQKGLTLNINTEERNLIKKINLNLQEKNLNIDDINIQSQFDYKPELINLTLFTKTKLQFDKIRLNEFNISMKSKINKKDKNIDLQLRGKEKNIFDFDNSFNITFDTKIEVVKIKLEENNFNINNLSQIIKIDEIKNNQKFLNWKLSISKSNIIFDMIRKHLEIKDFTTNISNLTIRENLFTIEDLNLSSKFSSSINLDDSFNIEDNFIFDINSNGNLKNGKFNNNVNLSNLQFSVKLKKENNRTLLKDILELIEKKYEIKDLKEKIKKILNKFEVCEINTNIEKFNFNNQINLEQLQFYNNNKIENEQDIKFVSIIKEINYKDTNLPEIIIPEGNINLTGKINDLKNFKILITYNLANIMNLNIESIIEINDDILNDLKKENIEINEIIKKLYCRTNSNLRFDFSKLNEIVKIEKLKINGELNNKINFYQEINKEPLINSLINLDKINVEYDRIKVEDLELDLYVNDLPINIFNKKNEIKNIQIIENSERNLYIKRIVFDKFETRDVNSNITLTNNFILLNNFIFNGFDGNLKVNLRIDYIKKNIVSNIRFNNIDLTYLTQNEKNRGINKISGIMKLELENIMSSKNKIIDISDIMCEIIVDNITKETILEILNFLDPENKNYDFKKINSILRFASPTYFKMVLFAGYLQIFIKFDSKLINDFTIDRIPLNKFNFIKELLKIEG